MVSYIYIEPDDVEGHIVEVETLVNVDNVIGRVVAPPTLMVAEREVGRQGGETCNCG